MSIQRRSQTTTVRYFQEKSWGLPDPIQTPENSSCGLVTSDEGACNLCHEPFLTPASVLASQNYDLFPRELECKHELHLGCLKESMRNDMTMWFMHPQCPLCKVDIFLYPSGIPTFPSFWGVSKKTNQLACVNTQDLNGTKGFYMIGPYPWRGKLDYSHRQYISPTNQRGAILFDKTSKFKNEVLCLYLMKPGEMPKLNIELLAIGDSLLDINTNKTIKLTKLQTWKWK